MKKRILSFLLAAVMLLSMIPAVSAAATTPEITKYNWVLDGILSVNFRVDAHGSSMDGYSVRVKIGDDTTYQNITKYTLENGLYVYTAKVMAHRLGETLTVSLMNGETEVQTATKTIADYVTAQKKQYPNSASLHALLDAMVSYGQYAANYKSEDTAFAGNSAVEAITAADLESHGYTIEGAVPAGLNPVASLYLDEACDLMVKFDAAVAAGHTLYVNGTAAEMKTAGTKLVYTKAQLLPQDWDTKYHFELKNEDGAVVFQMHYSVLSYLKVALSKNSSAASLIGLMKAMFLYWSKAEAYITAPDTLHDAIVLPESPIGNLWDGAATGYTMVFNEANDPDASIAASMINRAMNRLTGKNIGYCWGYDGQTNLDKYPTWAPYAKYIIIGDETLFQAAGLTMPDQDLGKTGYYIATKGASVFIMAGENADPVQAYQLGALAFLKHVMGFEMYAADSYSYAYSSADIIAIPTMEIVERSDYDYRMQATGTPATWPYQQDMGYSYQTPMGLVDGEMYHTIFFLMDYAKPSWPYLNVPAYVSHGDEGDWGECFQPCFTQVLANNSGIYDKIYSNMKAVIQADPGHDVFSVGVEDNPYVCDCSGCSADPAKPYIQFANKLAADLAADADLAGRDITLLAMAYRGYQTPPADVKAHENVAVLYAPIEAQWNVPLSQQTAYSGQMEGWSKVTDSLFCWFYQTNFNSYLFPIDSWSVAGENIAYAKALGADFMFYQGAHAAKSVSHFSTLKAYLEKAFTFNTEANYDLLVDNFFQNYFGPAAEAMRTYFDALQAHMVSAGVSGYYSAAPVKAQWPQAKLQEFMGYIAQAQAAVQADADAAVYLKRINLESFFPRYALLSFYDDTAAAGTKGALQAEFTELCGNQYNEHDSFDSKNSGWSCSHSYTAQTMADKYLYSPATSEAAAKYYLSCSKCGAIGTETFEYGTAIETVFLGDVELNADSSETVTLTAANLAGTVSAVQVNGTALDAASYSLSGNSLTISKAALKASVGQNAEITVVTNHGAYPYTAFILSKVIKTPAEFNNMMSYLDCAAANENFNTYTGYIALGNDIDFAGVAVTPLFCRDDGVNTIRIAAGGVWNDGAIGFNGTIDGRGYVINNLSIPNSRGLFGLCGDQSVIKNLSLTNVVANGGTENLFMNNKGLMQDVYISVSSWQSGCLFGQWNYGGTFNRVIFELTGAVPADGKVFAYTGSPALTDCYIIGAEALTNAGTFTMVADRTAMAGGDYAAFVDSGFWKLDADQTPVPVRAAHSHSYTLEVAEAQYLASAATTTAPAAYYYSCSCGKHGTETFSYGEPILTGEIDLHRDTVTISKALSGTVTAVKVDGVEKDDSAYAVSGTVLTMPAADMPATGGTTTVVELTVDGKLYTLELFAITLVIDNTTNIGWLSNWGEEAMPSNGYYVLGQDIDMAGYTMANGLFGSKTFSGTLDGRGHILNNLNVNSGGIIGASASTAVIKNIAFINVISTNETQWNTMFRMNGGGKFENVYLQLDSWVSSTLINPGAGFTAENFIVEYTASETATTSYPRHIFLNNNKSAFPNSYFIGTCDGTAGTVAYADRAAMAAAGNDYTAFTAADFWTLGADGTPYPVNLPIERETVEVSLTGIGDLELKAETTQTQVSIDLETAEAITALGGVTVNGTALAESDYALSGTTLSINTSALTGYYGKSADIAVSYETAAKDVTATCHVDMVISKIIMTAAEFKNAMTYLDKTLVDSNTARYDGYLVLGNDLDLSSDFYPLFQLAFWQQNNIFYESADTGNAPHLGKYGFQGTIDGRGYALNNISLSQAGNVGLFGVVGTNAVIKNVAIHFADTGTTGYVLARNFHGAMEDVYVKIDKWVSSSLMNASTNTGKLTRVIFEFAGTQPSDAAYPISGQWGAFTTVDSYIIGNMTTASEDGVTNYASRAAMAAAGNDYTAFTASGFWRLENGTPVPKGTIHAKAAIDLYRSSQVNLNQSITGTISSVKVNGVEKELAGYGVYGTTMAIPAADKPTTAGETMTVELIVDGQKYILDVVVATLVINSTANIGWLSNWGEDTMPSNGYYVLGQNIDMTGYTMANGLFGSKTFSGTLDGMGFQLSNLSTAGIIGASASTAVIKNIAFTHVTNTNATQWNTMFRMNGGGKFENVYLQLDSWVSSTLINPGAGFTAENFIVEYTAGETATTSYPRHIFLNNNKSAFPNSYFIGTCDGTAGTVAYATREAMAAAANSYDVFTATGFWKLDANGTPIWD